MFVKFFSIDALEPFDKEVQYWKISEFIFQISILLTGTCSCVCIQKMWMPVDNALKGYDCICFSKYESWWFMPVIWPLPCSQCCITSCDPWWVLGLVLKIRDAKIAKILASYFIVQTLLQQKDYRYRHHKLNCRVLALHLSLTRFLTFYC